MRSIGIDKHKEFCEVAICDGGQIQMAQRVGTTEDELQAFARNVLRPDDQVALESTSGAFELARLLKQHVAKVTVVDAKKVRAISHAKVKSDKFDARTLARLLEADLLPEVWVPDDLTAALRRYVSLRWQLVKQRSQAKNQISAVTVRKLKGRNPVTDLFGTKGRIWLESLKLDEHERFTVDSLLQTVDFLNVQIEKIEQKLALILVEDRRAQLLFSMPGIGPVTAASFLAAVGDIGRFPTSRHLVGYLGLDPRVRQSGNQAPRYGRISKQGNSQARHKLVEAAWVAVRTPGPLRAFFERVQSKSGSQVAIVAVARKICVIFWHMLTNGELYSWGQSSKTQQKLKDLARLAHGPAPRIRRTYAAAREAKSMQQAKDRLELQSVRLAESSYRQLVKSRQKVDKQKVRVSH